MHLQELQWTRRGMAALIGVISAAFISGIFVGLSSDSIYDGMFVPMGRFNIAAAGDWGCGIGAVNTVSNMKPQDPDVVLALGDLSYEGSSEKIGSICGDTSSWFDIVNPIIKRMLFVIGNHDLPKSTVVPDLLKQYQEKFKLCKFGKCDNFYARDKEGVHFLIMNSEEEYPIKRTGAQYSAVEADLKAASSNPSIKWIIVAFHTPMYASYNNIVWVLSGWMPHFHVNYNDFVKNFREVYHPLFDKYGVDLVLQGHAHNYQRTYPLVFDSRTEPALVEIPLNKPPLVTSTAKDTYVNPSGEIYLTVGTAGVSLDGVSPLEDNNFILDPGGGDKTITDDHFFAKVNDTDFGFLDLELSEDKSSLTGIFYSNDAPARTSINESRVPPVGSFHGFPTMGHKVIDYFTIKHS